MGRRQFSPPFISYTTRKRKASERSGASFAFFGEIFLYFFYTPIDVVHQMTYNITIKREEKQGGRNNDKSRI